MGWIWLLPLALAGLWFLLQWKSSRSDGTLLEQVHLYRVMMQYIMPTWNEGAVYYDVEIDAEPLLSYVQDARERFHVDITHCILAAVTAALHKTPEMNRFHSGHRLYQRKGVWITFSMKRKKMNKKARLATVKREFPEGQTFEQLCAYLNEDIKEQRSDKVTYHDKEYNLLTRFPRPVLRFGVRFLKLLDYYNILPHSFIEGDPLYTSAFVANIGSIKLRSAYHHLFDWGNCPAFVMAGKIEQKAVVIDGEIQVRKVLPLRITYDERIDDGLTASFGLQHIERVLEEPHRYLGCLQADGSDAVPLGEEPGGTAREK